MVTFNEQVTQTGDKMGGLSAKPGKREKRDAEILQALENQPEAKITAWAKMTGIPVASFRRRLRVMQRKGMVKIVALPVDNNGKYPFYSMIFIYLAPRELKSKRLGYDDQQTFRDFLRRRLKQQREFRGCLQEIKIEDALIVLGGSCDMVTFVRATKPEAVRDFVTKVLRLLPGVENTNTTMVF